MVRGANMVRGLPCRIAGLTFLDPSRGFSNERTGEWAVHGHDICDLAVANAGTLKHGNLVRQSVAQKRWEITVLLRQFAFLDTNCCFWSLLCTK